MTMELTIIISIISLLFSIIIGIYNVKRSNKKDVQDDTSQLTTVIIKLENISNGVSEIKTEMKSVKADIKEDHDRITRLEESSKQAHKRIDSIEFKKKGDV